MNVRDIIQTAASLGVGLDKPAPGSQEVWLNYLNQAHFDLYGLLAPVNSARYLSYQDIRADAPDIDKILFVENVFIKNQQNPLEKTHYQTVVAEDPFFERSGTPEYWYAQEKGTTWTLRFYPQPVQPGSMEFRVYYVPRPEVLTATDGEDRIPYPAPLHSALVDGLMYYMIQADQGFNDAVSVKIYLDRWERKKAALLASYQMTKNPKISTYSDI